MGTAFFRHNVVEGMADIRLPCFLCCLLNALDCRFWSIAVVDNSVTLAGVQELLNIVCTFPSHADNGVYIAFRGKLDGKCANSCAGSIYNERNDVFCRCPWEW